MSIILTLHTEILDLQTQLKECNKNLESFSKWQKEFFQEEFQNIANVRSKLSYIKSDVVRIRNHGLTVQAHADLNTPQLNAWLQQCENLAKAYDDVYKEIESQHHSVTGGSRIEEFLQMGNDLSTQITQRQGELTNALFYVNKSTSQLYELIKKGTVIPNISQLAKLLERIHNINAEDLEPILRHIYDMHQVESHGSVTIGNSTDDLDAYTSFDDYSLIFDLDRYDIQTIDEDVKEQRGEYYVEGTLGATHVTSITLEPEEMAFIHNNKAYPIQHGDINATFCTQEKFSANLNEEGLTDIDSDVISADVEAYELEVLFDPGIPIDSLIHIVGELQYMLNKINLGSSYETWLCGDGANTFHNLYPKEIESVSHARIEKRGISD